MAFDKVEKKEKPKLNLASLQEKMSYSSSISFYKTGSIVLDAIMGGGMPEGGFIELCSPSGVGKSTTMLHICRTMCDENRKVLYMDVEGGVNPNSLTSFGLDPHIYDSKLNPNGNFILLNPSTYSDAQELMDFALDEKSGVKMIVIDSITFLLPTKRLDSDVEGVQIAIDAVTTTNFLKKYNAECMRKKVSVWLVNQMRTTIDSRTGGNVKSAGGLALEHTCQVRIKLRKKQALTKTVTTNISKEVVPYGSVVVAEAFKNRFAPPNRKMDMAVYFGRGISNIHTYKEMLQSKGLIKQGGAGYFKVNLYEGMEPVSLRSAAAVDGYLSENIAQVQSLIDSFGGISILSDEEQTSRISKEMPKGNSVVLSSQREVFIGEDEEVEILPGEGSDESLEPLSSITTEEED